jgi:hypothetical protein
MYESVTRRKRVLDTRHDMRGPVTVALVLLLLAGASAVWRRRCLNDLPVTFWGDQE